MTEPPGPARLPEGGDPAIFTPAVDWWNATVAARGRLPARADLRPEDLGGRTLPHVLLVDVGDAGKWLRFRVMGSAHVAFNQVDLSGRDFDTIYPEGGTLDYVRGLYRDMCATRRPWWSKTTAAKCWPMWARRGATGGVRKWTGRTRRGRGREVLPERRRLPRCINEADGCVHRSQR